MTLTLVGNNIIIIGRNENNIFGLISMVVPCLRLQGGSVLGTHGHTHAVNDGTATPLAFVLQGDPLYGGETAQGAHDPRCEATNQKRLQYITEVD